MESLDRLKASADADCVEALAAAALACVLSAVAREREECAQALDALAEKEEDSWSACEALRHAAAKVRERGV